MSEYGQIIVGKDNGQPFIEITDEVLDASIPFVTFIKGEIVRVDKEYLMALRNLNEAETRG